MQRKNSNLSEMKHIVILYFLSKVGDVVFTHFREQELQMLKSS